eukprot:1706992-Alexandrium_andersonii.AAC.1
MDRDRERYASAHRARRKALARADAATPNQVHQPPAGPHTPTKAATKPLVDDAEKRRLKAQLESEQIRGKVLEQAFALVNQHNVPQQHVQDHAMQNMPGIGSNQ